MKRLFLATLLLCLIFSSAASAQAATSRDDRYAHTVNAQRTTALHRKAAAHNRRTFHRHARPRHRVHHARGGAGSHAVAREAFHSRGLGARPRAWCGWYMRQVLGVADRAYDLARNWARWGRPASPGTGVMVVWSHHVGMITGRTAKGEWIVKSGNDGGAVRERPRSISGAIAFRAG